MGQRLPDGRIIIRAGNGTLEEAGQIGIDKVRIVERNPDELIVVVADDLPEDQWVKYAIADNRASDESDWEVETLKELHEEFNLEDWFFEGEIAAWDEPVEDPDDGDRFPPKDSKEINCTCPNCGHDFVRQLGS